jgi:hypothetical protein
MTLQTTGVQINAIRENVTAAVGFPEGSDLQRLATQAAGSGLTRLAGIPSSGGDADLPVSRLYHDINALGESWRRGWA